MRKHIHPCISKNKCNSTRTCAATLFVLTDWKLLIYTYVSLDMCIHVNMTMLQKYTYNSIQKYVKFYTLTHQVEICVSMYIYAYFCMCLCIHMCKYAYMYDFRLEKSVHVFLCLWVGEWVIACACLHTCTYNRV